MQKVYFPIQLLAIIVLPITVWRLMRVLISLKTNNRDHSAIRAASNRQIGFNPLRPE